MPHHELKTLPDGKIEVKLETGETFAGDPLEVTAKLADSKVETRRHFEAKEKELEEKYRQPPQTQVQQPPAVQPTEQEKQLQDYLIEQTAKALGFTNADEYRSKLNQVVKVTAEVENQVVASNFLATCPDFPNTPEAIDAISKKLDEMGWPYDQRSMVAAHALCSREAKYKPLTTEEQNAAWEQGLRNSNRQPPPMIQSQSPDNRGQQQPDPWSMKLDDLRKAALEAQR